MTLYLARRLLLSTFTFLVVTACVYAAVRLLPGRPAWGDEAGADAEVEAWLRAAHADDPIPTGYSRWLGDLARLDLGVSLSVQPGRTVGSVIADALPYTLRLGVLSLLAGLALAVPLGILTAWRPRSLGARSSTAALYALHALPAFWLALALQHASGWIGLPAIYVPDAGLGGPAAAPLAAAGAWILPVAALALGSLAFLIRFCRSALLEAAGRPFFQAARARGAGEAGALWRHALAHTAVPLLSLLGLVLPGIVSGSVIVESIFGLPGLGRLLFRAAGRRDYPVLMALTVLTAAATVAAHLVCDLLYRWADPRISLGTDPEAGR